MQWFSTNIYTSCILNYPFLSELKLYTAETYLPRINFIIPTRVWLKIYVSIFLWVVKTSQDFHRTDRTESLPPYPILICTTFGISTENFMLLSTDARFLQFQQLMECTILIAGLLALASGQLNIILQTGLRNETRYRQSDKNVGNYERSPTPSGSFIRPPDIVCRRTYILPGFFSFFRQLISELGERTQPYLATWSEVSVIWITFLGRLHNSTATLTTYVFGTKHDIDNRSSALTTTRGLAATSSQNDMNFGPQTASKWTAIFTHPM